MLTRCRICSEDALMIVPEDDVCVVAVGRVSGAALQD